MEHHKLMGGVVLAGAAYNLYYDYVDGNTTMDYVIDGAVFIVGAMILMKK